VANHVATIAAIARVPCGVDWRTAQSRRVTRRVAKRKSGRVDPHGWVAIARDAEERP